MKSHWIRAAVIAFWLVMAGWLIRTKAFPEYFSHSISGYGGFLSRDVLVADSWMRVMLNSSPIGYSHTIMDVDEADFTARYTIHSLMDIQMNLMGVVQRIHTDVSASLNGLHDLQRFVLRMSAGDYRLTLTGQRTGKTSFLVNTITPNSSQKRTVEIPEDVILYSPLMEVTMKRLKPGQEVTVRTLDPATLTPVRLTVKALRREKVTVRGKEHDSLLLSSEYGGATVLTWLDPNGEALRQETPFGWSLERCTADEAFATLRQSRESPDMLAGMAVKVEGTIRDARRCESLTLRLAGVPFQREELQTPRQEVLRLDGNVAEIRVRRETEGGRSDPPPAPEFLQATPALPSDHAEIAALAATITAACRTPAEKALAIHHWVFENLEKSMTVSLPSALDVLRSRKGDCNEHTYLAVALARAAGLPARIMVGLAYHEGRFYYHAWPATFTGQWVESDPTWGQPAVDASHIALVQGELPEQMKLLRIFGQLRVTVLGEAPAGGSTEVSRD